MIPVVRGVVIIVGALTLGILMLPILFFLALLEEYATSERRAEKREDKKERSGGKGLFIRY